METVEMTPQDWNELEAYEIKLERSEKVRENAGWIVGAVIAVLFASSIAIAVVFGG